MANLKPTEKVQAGGYAGAGAWIKTEGSGWFRLLRVRQGRHER